MSKNKMQQIIYVIKISQFAAVNVEFCNTSITFVVSSCIPIINNALIPRYSRMKIRSAKIVLVLHITFTT